MNRIKIWIQAHQITAFFVLTFIITWGLGFVYYLVLQDGVEILVPLLAVATCGPGLAGIILTSMCNDEPKGKMNWITFLVLLLVSTAVFLLQNKVINGVKVNPVLAVFSVVFAIPVAVILNGAFSRNPSVRRYLASVYEIRPVWGWLLLAPLLMFGINWLSIVIGGKSVSLSAFSFSGWRLVRMLGVTFLYQLFFFNLTGEEVGWRGFALPRMLARMNPIFASLLLAFFWAIWHAFYWGALGEPVLIWSYWGDKFVQLIPATVLINWFTIRSKGSILTAGVLHAASNTLFEYMPVDWQAHTAIIYAAAVLIILLERWWKKLPADHPAVQEFGGKTAAS